MHSSHYPPNKKQNIIDTAVNCYNAMAFQPGQSGNLNGRPKGTRNAATALRAKLLKETPAIIRKLVALASKGDVAAAKLILDRALPPLRPVAATVNIPGAEGASLSQQASAVLEAITSGKLEPDIGASILSALANVSRTLEVSEISRRLDALEADRVPE